MTKCYASFDDWLDEMEGFGTRRERMFEEVEHPGRYVEWLRVAWKLGAAAEREACAKIVDPPKSPPVSPEARIARMCRESIAAAIRARGTT